MIEGSGWRFSEEWVGVCILYISVDAQSRWNGTWENLVMVGKSKRDTQGRKTCEDSVCEEKARHHAAKLYPGHKLYCVLYMHSRERCID